MSTATAKPETQDETPKLERQKALDVDKIARGHLVLIRQYAHVQNMRSDVAHGPAVELKDAHTGTVWTRRGVEILERMSTADQFDEESVVELPKTKLVEVLEGCGDEPFTVVWVKKAGEERTLRGRYISNADHNLGYSWVEDLDLPANDRLRQVDHRTIQSIVVGGVKYVLKGK